MSMIPVIEVPKKPSKAASKPEPDDKRRKPMVVQMRGSDEWKAWVESIADKEGDAVAKLFERAVRKFAKDSGYPDPPRR